MKVLLDTNIVIHRETNNVLKNEIGVLFRWLDKLGYTKCVHPEPLKKSSGIKISEPSVLWL